MKEESQEREKLTNTADAVVFAYTRKEALADGVLVDVSELAKEAGFKYPVAITSTAYQQYIIPQKELLRYGQSVDGRMWDVLMVLRQASQQSKESTIQFSPIFLLNERSRKAIELKAVCGPGDTTGPVITIMLKEED